MGQAIPAIVVYSVGICKASVCAVAGTTGEELERAANLHHPTGVGPWKLSDEPTFASGDPNPCPCNNEPDERLHWLLVC